jgi:hypothetical protein
VVASDLERYRPLARFLGLTFALLGLVLLGYVGAGMPWWWSAVEGPTGIGLGALMFWLARPDHGLRKQEEAQGQPPETSPS